MKNPSNIVNFSPSIFVHHFILITGGIFLFVIFCFVPFRIIIAMMLFVFLLILINKIYTSPAFNYNEIDLLVNDEYEKAKQQWKKEIEHEQRIKAIVNKRNQKDWDNKLNASQKNLKNSGHSIISIVQKNGEIASTYFEVKKRWRKEINDMAFERRIQNIFCRIRESETEDYERGIKEIEKLLSMRRDSLLDMPLQKKIS